MTDAPPSADASIDAAPLPTDKTLKMRRSIPVQVYRFAAINLKMMKIVRKGHQG